MLLAAFEPGKEMAIANFFLAICFLFTIALPLLLITRGDKTESNRDFIAATLNPWSQIAKEIELTPVVISGMAPTIETQPKLEVISENIVEPITGSDEGITLDPIDSETTERSATNLLETENEVLAA
tara:strand:+ start:142 stop:522 length:381 start_codon:yes stop_codon:yes gene_type:complete